MKIKSLLNLARLDLLTNPAILLIPIMFAGMGIGFMRSSYMFSIDGVSVPSNLFIILLLSYQFIFQMGFVETWSATALMPRVGEFWFTRPILRSNLFKTKVAVFFLLSMGAPFLIWLWAHHQPVIKLELPYRTPEHREKMKNFYLQHYPLASLEKDPKDRTSNRVYVVLPKGQVDYAWWNLVISSLCACGYLTIMLCTVSLRWCQRYLPFLMILPIIFLPLFGLWMGSYKEQPISWNQQGMALLASYPILSIVILILFFWLLLRIAQRKFCEMELL